MTRSKMGARRTFEKVQDRGSWYPVILDGNIVGYKAIFEETFASRHMTGRIMCANERRPCTSLEDTHGITHT